MTGGKQSAVLGGDPHLPQTLPSVWYEVALSAPGYQVFGVSVPGLPGTQAGQTMAVDWMGNVPSADLASLLAINQASSFAAPGSPAPCCRRR